MDRLPIEIIKLCLSFLDDKTARVARVASINWFTWIKYSNFNIHFARADTLPLIIDRLSTYQYPIKLTLTKAINLSFKEIITNITKLTQLKAFKLIPQGDSSRFVPSIYCDGLAVLSNLEELDFGEYIFPPDLLPLFPKMRKTKHAEFNDDPLNADEVLKTCTQLEYLSYLCPDSNLLQGINSLKELNLNGSLLANVEWIQFSRLTNLKVLTTSPDYEHNIDVTYMTWLEELAAGTPHITGLENCKNLTSLSISSATGTELPELIAPPNMEKFSLSMGDCTNVSLGNFSHLTSLTSVELHCQSVLLETLGTSLQQLSLTVKVYNLENMNHLINLTQMKILRNEEVREFQPINNLTNLVDLTIENDSEVYHVAGARPYVSLPNLENLTRIELALVKIDVKTLQHLTKLKQVKISHSEFDQEQWQSLHHLQNLTELFLEENEVDFEYDYNVINGMPLKVLNITVPRKLNEWKVSTTLTTLENLSISLAAEDDLLTLTALKNLTNLTVNGHSNMTGVHLTSLTNLQNASLEFKSCYDVADLTSKLTRLFHFEDDFGKFL